ncbi:uncharacterized protein LOC110102232 [Dendrobium catenatum]|uniref:Uncharacterized protein n=1 Tax=Dendrobium catenatum TaxID=906689 RepID=A0A2I0WIT7_9ASPA|nr:uncharacterized protein LOC110102232 [Dendrobium catenatum]PKU75569.1 hypothetical protein MA16_Dca011345 [Dendrobium catenatum]
MEKEVILVGCTVGFLGLLSAALGFAAEATRIRASGVLTRAYEECIYPKSPALYLGLLAAVALALAQAIINFFAGCICCRRNLSRSNTNWNVALISFAVSWFTFVIAFLLLLAGAALNDKRSMEKIYFSNNCYVLKAGVFSGGAVLSLSSVSLGIIYYVALHSPKSQYPSWSPSQNQGIALGQPQIPPQSAEPVFVPEDTYNRQRIT